MRKSKKVFIVIIVIFVVLFITGLVLENKTTTDNIKDIIEYYDCTYYKTTSSTEQGFGKDIYVAFPYDAVESDGTSNQYYYEQVIGTLSATMNKTNFRIIDEKQKLNVRVVFKDEGTVYSINGDNNYYETEKMKVASNVKQSEKLTELSVSSNELNTILNNNWSRAASKQALGTVDLVNGNYDCYVDEGYRIRTVGLKIFNIIFTNEYKEEVLGGIRTGMNNEDIISILGEPLYVPEDNTMVIGYKTEKFYTFFYNGEISIYRAEEKEEDKENELENLIMELNQSSNYKEFLNKITDLYPDFDERKDEENKTEIFYRLRGMKVTFSNNDRNGLTLYSNYSGAFAKDTSKLPKNVYVENTNPIFEYEYEKDINIELILER